MKLNLSQALTLFNAQLRLDLRNPQTGDSQSSRLILAVISFAASAVVLALALVAQDASLAQFSTISLAFGFVLAAFGITGSYDDLMGRPREHTRSLSFPVSLKTHYVARVLSILFFGVVMAVSAAIPLSVIGTFHLNGMHAILLGIQVFAAMMITSMASLAIIWGLILNVPARIHKLILSIVRAVLIAIIVIGYQLVSTQPTISIETTSSQTAWLANTGLTLLALALVIIYTFVFPKRYDRLLQHTAALTALSGDQTLTIEAPSRWEKWAVRSGELRAAFGISVAAFRSDRLVRGRVMPAAFLAFIFALFGWWVDGLGDLFLFGVHELLTDPALHMHLSVMTILLFSSQVAMQGIRISDNPEAAWIYGSSHSPDAQLMQLGAQKALLFRILGPLHIAIGLLLAFSMPVVHAVAHSVFWFLGCALITRLQMMIRPRFPLSQRSDHFSAGQRFLPLLLAVPASIILISLQIATFTSVPSAFILLAGLVVFHWGLATYITSMASRRATAMQKEKTPVSVLETV